MQHPPSATRLPDLWIEEMATPSPGHATRLASYYAQQTQTDAERQVIEDLFRHWQASAEISVRAALADALCSAHDLPHDLALRMARDVERVAIPMLRWSEALTETDLLSLIAETPNPYRLEAIAGRSCVPEPLSDALIAHGDPRAVERLVTNLGARFSSEMPERIAHSFPEHQTILEGLFSHPQVPATILDTLITHVADHLKTYLSQTYKQTKYTVTLSVRTGETFAFLSALPPHAPLTQIEALVSKRRQSGMLDEDWILHALALGRSRVFLASLALRAGIPYQNAETLTSDATGFTALWQQARLPPDQAETARGYFFRVQTVRNAPEWHTSDWPERWQTLMQSIQAHPPLSPADTTLRTLLRKAILQSRPVIQPAIFARKSSASPCPAPDGL